MPNDESGRRQFVVLCGAGTCAIAAAVAVPAAMFVGAPLKKGTAGAAKRFVVAHLDELVRGVPKRVSIVGDEIDAWTLSPKRRLGSVWLLRTGDRAVSALSVLCPHLGCGIELAPGGKSYACPCHDSAFDLAGQRASGPSPRAMDALAAEVSEAGEVSVLFVRFRTGVADKVEIG